MSIESSRERYDNTPLLERDVAADPIEQLARWLDAAYAHPDVREANAMTLATAGKEGRLSARLVLLRGLDGRGLRFYTSYFSRKAEQISENPRVAATFFWAPLHRQVRVEGSAYATLRGRIRRLFRVATTGPSAFCLGVGTECTARTA